MSGMQMLGAIAVVVVMLGVWIIGSRFGSEGRNNAARFTDNDADGAPDLTDQERARARAVIQSSESDRTQTPE